MADSCACVMGGGWSALKMVGWSSSLEVIKARSHFPFIFCSHFPLTKIKIKI